MTFAKMLRAKEQAYSGGPSRVTRRRVSDRDPRGAVHGIPGTMLSGARFIDGTGYADVYAEHLAGRAEERLVVVELGTLLGVGLAVWCDALPNARVIGLDVDIQRVDMGVLRERGAFGKNSPAIHFLDELSPDAPRRLARILRGEKIDVLIDDALHDDDSILAAMHWALPAMADGFIYFIEDNGTVDARIRHEHPELRCERHGRLTVVRGA